MQLEYQHLFSFTNELSKGPHSQDWGELENDPTDSIGKQCQEPVKPEHVANQAGLAHLEG